MIRSAAVLLAALLGVLSAGCGDPGATSAPAGPPPALGFVDRLEGSGVDFVNHSGVADSKPWIHEAKGGGNVLLDYDGDGDLDVFFVDGNSFTLDDEGEVLTRTANPAAGPRLYRNDGGFRFTDVTAAAGLGAASFGITGATADYDGDGDQDLFVANWGPNLLYRNNGDGTFTDVTAAAGVAGPERAYSTCAAFLDANRDGHPDLYVANYCGLQAIMRRQRGSPPGDWIDGLWRYAGPRSYPPQPDVLYQNLANGSFVDVTSRVLARGGSSYGFQPVPFDADNDGDTDLFVANDSDGNFLWVNDGAGNFTEAAVAAGVALGGSGAAQAGMGAAAGDYDRDGRMDLVVTNFSSDITTVYRNATEGTEIFFEDVSHRTGLDLPTFSSLSWGVAFRDFDLDGVPDLFIANGGVYPTDRPDRVFQGCTYAQPMSLLLGTGPPEWRFRDVSGTAGPAFRTAHVGRGASFGDMDGDGDEDVVVSCLNGPPLLLENRLPRRGHWVRIRPVGTTSNRDAIGARIAVTAGGVRQIADHTLSLSFGGSGDPRVLFGLGPAGTVDEMEIRWPSGKTEKYADLAADRVWTVVEGEGPVR